MDVTVVIQYDECPTTVSTETWGSMRCGHLTRDRVGGESGKASWRRQELSHVSPEAKAGVGKVKGELARCAENSICKGPEAKENLVYFFMEVKIDLPCFLLLQRAKRSHVEINKHTWYIHISFPLYHLSAFIYLMLAPLYMIMSLLIQVVQSPSSKC